MNQYKPYPKYKPTGIEWLGDVPEHWDVKLIKRTFHIRGGSTPDSNDPSFWDGDIVWVTPSDLSQLKSKWINDSHRKITLKGLLSCGARLAPAGSIVISTRAPIGSMAIASKPLCTNQGCKSLIPEEKQTNTLYFLYFFSICIELLNIRGKGATFLELSGDELGAFESIVPPGEEQSAIATYLDHQTARIDQLIDKKEQFIKLLQEKRTALITAAVTGKFDVRTGKPYPKYKPSGIEWLGEVPEHWDIKPVYSLARVINGHPFDSSFFNPDVGYPLVRIRDLGKTHTETCFSGSFVKAAAITSDDVLIGMDGDFNVGRWNGEGKALLNQRMCCVRGKNNFITLLLEYWLPVPLKVINDITYSTTVKHLSSKQVEKIMVALPINEDEQSAIATYLDHQTARIDQLIEKTRQSIELLKEKRTALITAAVTGKIDVRDWKPEAA